MTAGYPGNRSSGKSPLVGVGFRYDRADGGGRASGWFGVRLDGIRPVAIATTSGGLAPLTQPQVTALTPLVRDVLGQLRPASTNKGSSIGGRSMGGRSKGGLEL